MRPNVEIGDGVLVLRQKGLDHYDYADLIVFRHPTKPGDLWLKRLIGKPGDQLAYHDRQLWLNGRNTTHKKHIESLVKQKQYTIYSSYLDPDWGTVTVPKSHVFLMGDNRGNSEDSRMFGAVEEGLLFGKVVWFFWKSEASF